MQAARPAFRRSIALPWATSARPARRAAARRPHEAAAETDEIQGFTRLFRALGPADSGVEEPVGHVVKDGLVLGEEELLEHEADLGRPQRGELPVGQGRHVETGQAVLVTALISSTRVVIALRHTEASHSSPPLLHRRLVE